MLELAIPEREFFDEETEMFVTVPATTLHLEHSLLSISKWESVWRKPFLHGDDKTNEEILDYFRCMTLNKNVDPNVYLSLTVSDIETIKKYIETDQTATWFSEDNRPPSREIVTSEVIYYWMVAQGIPFEAQKWHLSRLLTLVRICNINNSPEKHKMSRNAILSRNRALNAARRKSKRTKG